MTAEESPQPHEQEDTQPLIKEELPSSINEKELKEESQLEVPSEAEVPSKTEIPPSESGEQDREADGEHHNEDPQDEEMDNVQKNVLDQLDGEQNSSDEEMAEERGVLLLGGQLDTPAFALIAGVLEDPDDVENRVNVSVPITRLPAVLGRSHDTSDPHFFGMGNRKALSRKQCVIYYRDAAGGRVEQYEKSDEMVYKKPSKTKEEVIRFDEDKPLPSQGFFVMQCLGKNGIFVSGKRVKQGEVALLTHGTSIRMNAYNLYFLLPETDADQKKMKVPNPQFRKVQKSSFTVPELAQPGVKRKFIGGSGSSGVASELERLPVKTLLARMNEAIESNQWERRHQMIGSAISLHAVTDAARSAEIKELAKDGEGVARTDIMSWIQKSDRYSKWKTQMLKKMEPKSYQSNISKALGKAGYTRTGTTGRHVKWLLPFLGDDDEGERSESDDSAEEEAADESGDDEESEKGSSRDGEESGDEENEDPGSENDAMSEQSENGGDEEDIG